MDRILSPLRRMFDGWTKYHASVFLLTFFSYVLFHSCRKAFSNVKPIVEEEWTLPQQNISEALRDKNVWPTDHYAFTNGDTTADFLGVLDGVFLGAYALGLYVSGYLGDRFDPRLVLTIGMILSGIFAILFGSIPEWLHFYSPTFYVIIWALAGLSQASGWPTEVCIIGNWFGRGSRGFVLGLWSACASVGNIIGSLLAGELVQYGYEYIFLTTGTMLIAGSVVVYFGMVSAPRDVGLPDPEASDEHEVEQERPKPIGFFRALWLPGVLSYCLAYACLKMVNYGFFFWLPYYMKHNFGWTTEVADDLSTWYDWGGIAGGVVAGVITDRMPFRTPLVVAFLVVACGALFGYDASPNDKLVNGVLLSVAGFFIGGPANLISAAVAADLGRCPEVRGNAEALSTVTGLVDGTGSVGAALGQVVLPFVQQVWNWAAVFYMFIVMIMLTVMCLVPLCYREISTWWAERRRRTVTSAGSDVPYQSVSPVDPDEPGASLDDQLQAEMFGAQAGQVGPAIDAEN